jgi:Zn-dependent protease
MFTDPGRNQFDLNFRLIGIPVRIHPMFWLMSVLLGESTLRLGIEYLLIWVACVFVSILIHEMGHVVAARAFRVWSEIVLYGFGGLAIGAGQMRSRWQHIIVCFAGPLAGFLFLGLVVLCLPTLAPEEWEYVKNRVLNLLGLAPLEVDLVMSPIRAILEYLFWINLIWGLVNLLPIWPLDGGQISRDVFTMVSPRSGASIALGMSLVLSGLLLANAILVSTGQRLLPSWVPGGGMWSIFMFAYLALGSFMALQEEQSRSRWTDEHWSRWDDER